MDEHRKGGGFDGCRRDETSGAFWLKLTKIQINVSWMLSDRGTFSKNKL